VAGATQRALYEGIDLDLSWSEQELPQRERTKHVHGLHPYLGKFIPQLVEVFLDRYFSAADVVYDPFCGSGTTLVEASVFGAESVGCDISAFNCHLANAKTADYSNSEVAEQLASTLARALDDADSTTSSKQTPSAQASPWLRSWFAPRALSELTAYREATRSLAGPVRSLAEVVLTRSARSARLTKHFDLDFPRTPVKLPYMCHKHKRTCEPVQEAAKFLKRYTNDTSRRIEEYALLRSDRRAEALHGDARVLELPRTPTGVITSPPYPGLIDYHEQHRYAYELLGLTDRRSDEIGAAAGGRTLAAQARYSDDMVAVFTNARRQIPAGAPVVIVVNDALELYPSIVERSELRLEERLTRHVNRRTGRRAGEFYESVLICRA
jgi:hypothetical protein